MENNAIAVRPANDGDIPAMAHLMNELGYPTSTGDMLMRYRRIAGNPLYGTLVAEMGGHVVGMAGMLVGQYYEKNAAYIRIAVFVIDSPYRNQGIGKCLLQCAEEWAKEKGAGVIVLNSGNRPERENAHQFYRKQGYQVQSTGFVKEIAETRSVR